MAPPRTLCPGGAPRAIRSFGRRPRRLTQQRSNPRHGERPVRASSRSASPREGDGANPNERQMKKVVEHLTTKEDTVPTACLLFPVGERDLPAIETRKLPKGGLTASGQPWGSCRWVVPRRKEEPEASSRTTTECGWKSSCEVSAYAANPAHVRKILGGQSPRSPGPGIADAPQEPRMINLSGSSVRI